MTKFESMSKNWHKNIELYRYIANSAPVRNQRRRNSKYHKKVPRYNLEGMSESG
jgi:hypothetical protein